MNSTIDDAAANSQDGNKTSTLSEMDSILAALKSIAKYKARSYDTSKNVHVPLLQAHTKDSPENGPTVVLLGDSMLERMTTTGQSPNFVAPWPSPVMLNDDTLSRYQLKSDEHPTLHRFDRVFNAGVGGDKIQNVAYRLVGDEERGLPGLLPLLARCGTVKVWLVHVGTNNLSPRYGLRYEDVAALEVLLRALLRASPRSRLLLTGLFDRKDMSSHVVWGADDKLKDLGNLLMDRGAIERVLFISRPLEINIEEHLVDHVHLNLAGYRVWTEFLFVSMVAALQWVDRNDN
ncbi:hypothetical protein N657DRAFT_373667 [Parathielavia appendiculata]|uniref:SGNH hydrolase-type esterase domain-containing protein n=1 Tax=Parathielavia appendiculata TaxID=2587402 RepID=A0AAN6YYI4_9PEZI|nr:hypothetical protein N657DRAFT_373667 [Parathielavia appendiculata]